MGVPEQIRVHAAVAAAAAARGRPQPPASWLIFKDIFIYAWTIYSGSTVKFNAFYEYCGLFWRSAMRVGVGDSCGWRYYDLK